MQAPKAKGGLKRDGATFLALSGENVNQKRPWHSLTDDLPMPSTGDPAVSLLTRWWP